MPEDCDEAREIDWTVSRELELIVSRQDIASDLKSKIRYPWGYMVVPLSFSVIGNRQR